MAKLTFDRETIERAEEAFEGAAEIHWDTGEIWFGAEGLEAALIVLLGKEAASRIDVWSLPGSITSENYAYEPAAVSYVIESLINHLEELLQ